MSPTLVNARFSVLLLVLAAAATALMPHGLNDDPNFFPITVWLNNPQNAASYAAANFTVFILDEQFYPVSSSIITSLRGSNMKLIGAPPNTVSLSAANTDVLLSWFSLDEPDNAQPLPGGGYGPCITPTALKVAYDKFKTQDTAFARPVFVNFGRGVADVNWVGRGTCTSNTGLYIQYGAALDIASFDVYPRNEGLALEYVATGMDNLKGWIPNKPIYCYIETTKYESGSPAGPTPTEMEFMVWSAIVHGANGINYFCHILSPSFTESGCLQDTAMRTALGKVNGKLKDLAPVLNTVPTTSVTVVSSAGTSSPIDVLAKVSGSNLYIFATSMRSTSTTGTFTIPTTLSPAATADVLYEGRSVSVAAQKFSDSFGGYRWHIYRIAIVTPTSPTPTTTMPVTTTPSQPTTTPASTLTTTSSATTTPLSTASSTSSMPAPTVGTTSQDQTTPPPTQTMSTEVTPSETSTTTLTTSTTTTTITSGQESTLQTTAAPAPVTEEGSTPPTLSTSPPLAASTTPVSNGTTGSSNKGGLSIKSVIVISIAILLVVLIVAAIVVVYVISRASSTNNFAANQARSDFAFQLQELYTPPNRTA